MSTYTGISLLIFHPEVYVDQYGCQDINSSSLPFELRARPIVGWIQLVLVIVSEILYLLCMYSIRKHIEISCYKLLFYIGVIDMMGMVVGGVTCSLWAITGTFFCDSPLSQYINGGFAMSFWFAETTAEFILAFNRCLDLLAPRIWHILFNGRRTWLWMLLPTGYATFGWLFTRPVVFSSIDFAFFFNPYEGYRTDTTMTYVNYVHAFNNTFVSFVLCTTYVTFCVLWLIRVAKYREIVESSATTATANVIAQQQLTSSAVDVTVPIPAAVVPSNKGAKTGTNEIAVQLTFLQVLFISIFNAFAASLGVYMQYFPSFPALIVVAQITYILTHAAPPFIYLIFNKTIRKDIEMLLRKLFCAKTITKLNGITIFVKPKDQQHISSVHQQFHQTAAGFCLGRGPPGGVPQHLTINN